MKLSVVCDSLLLSDALERFLRDYLTPYRDSDIVVCDKFLDIDKPIFMIGKSVEANLSKPFTKSTLLLKIEELYRALEYDSNDRESNEDIKELEAKIERLCVQFTKDLTRTIIGHYEKS